MDDRELAAVWNLILENEMNYEFWFWIGIAFVVGRFSTRPLFYYGRDEEKYRKAWIAVMPK